MIEDIKKYIDIELGIDISKKSNKEPYTFGRAIFFELCDNHYKTSTQKMANHVGLKSHCSVLNSRNDTFPYAMTFPYYKEAYFKLEAVLKGTEKETFTKIKILEQEVDMLRKEVDRLRLVQMNMPHTK